MQIAFFYDYNELKTGQELITCSCDKINLSLLKIINMAITLLYNEKWCHNNNHWHKVYNSKNAITSLHQKFFINLPC